MNELVGWSVLRIHCGHLLQVIALIFIAFSGSEPVVNYPRNVLETSFLPPLVTCTIDYIL